ncbi:hypothetical protein HYH03_000092 [Edaphochlamys debaryana]|uniref:Uncharacterized protein n=1 Tax=Edaphochlamys debaryana TaxID=47281 RepID=A0A835YEU4_9CHLO|nr:hypothetical protein HYH03_000092 [Edaphochlamys debaryana]|eukprot:KAG2501587.1 hypothetical protein HYH03_000092 [Edaphochlamys debaryana]
MAGAGVSYSLQQAFRLKGHDSAVQCCAASEAWVASGGEDGRLLVHDLSAASSAGASPDAAPQPPSAPGPSTKFSAASPATRPLLSLALTSADGQPAAVAALAFNPAAAHAASLFAAAGSLVHHVDTRAGSVVQTFTGSKEEVGGLAVACKGGHLVAGDDAGEVQVYDLAAGKQYKSIRNVHKSICSSVAFRAHKPWDLLSGGLDSTVAKYDFSRPKCIDRWDMAALSAAAGAAGGGGGGGQIWNPPFVHQVAVPPAEERPWCQWVAAARGDGAVAVLDADVSSAASGSSGPTTQVAGARGGGARGGRGSGAASSKAGAADKGTLAIPLVLDSEAGGHTRPVCSVAWAPQQASASASSSGAPGAAAAGPGRLYSGGEDARVVVWGVADALAARAAGHVLVPPGQLRGGQTSGGSGAAGAGGESGDGEAEQASEEAGGREREGEGSGEGGDRGKGKVAERRTAVLAEVQHGRKINQLCCLAVEGQELVAVAAVSKFVSLYRLAEVELG